MITHPIPSVMFPECLLTLANTKFILFSSQEVYYSLEYSYCSHPRNNGFLAQHHRLYLAPKCKHKMLRYR